MSVLLLSDDRPAPSVSMFYVYILQSHNKDLYIGYTTDLKRRIEEHNSNRSTFTSKKGPWDLVYYEAYRNQEDAQARERSLKNYGSALGHLKKRLDRTLQR